MDLQPHSETFLIWQWEQAMRYYRLGLTDGNLIEARHNSKFLGGFVTYLVDAKRRDTLGTGRDTLGTVQLISIVANGIKNKVCAESVAEKQNVSGRVKMSN